MFPDTTHLPIKFIMSTIVVTETGDPIFFISTFCTLKCNSIRGSGPLDTPPNVLSGTPILRICE